VAGGGRLFSGGQLGQVQGRHARQHLPDAGELYVAGLDVGGQQFADAEDACRHDATVLTIARAVLPAREALVQEPRLEVVDHLALSGAQHDALLTRLADLLGEVWRVRRLVVDATGLGETLARLLARVLGQNVVRPLRFSAETKSRLGYNLLAAVNGGRLKMYAADASPEYAAFWREMEQARAVYRPGRQMSFFVEPSRGHDDYLISLALAVEAAGDLPVRPRVAKGRAPAFA
jgi:hypothetical protein